MSALPAYDIIIIGTGAGGGTLAYGLRDSGAKVLILERGDFLPQEPENWSPEAVFRQNRYKTSELWHDANGGSFQPGVHYVVGGNTKLYGAALPRLRQDDFDDVEHAEGVSPRWPITYDQLEPYYARAERLYLVHGQAGLDPTDPPRSGPYPFPPMPQDPYMAGLTTQLQDQGLHPHPLPLGLDYRPGGRCIRCKTCDAFPCRVLAKGDADVCAVRPALATAAVALRTRSYARRLLVDATGRQVVGVEIDHASERLVIKAGLVIVACGAVNSAALLLRSTSAHHPAGLANSSGLVGRHYMVHNNSVLIAVHPTRRNTTVFQKTVAVNDFYRAGIDPDFPFPMGNLQPVGKLQAAMLAGAAPRVLDPLLGAAAARSVDWWVMSEDLPDPLNRVTLTPTSDIRIHWRPNNLLAHDRLMRAAKRMLRDAGYPLLLSQHMGIATNSHQCGTLRFGTDPETSVLDPLCRAHDLDNLFVVDSSFFPSSAAVNPALTIAAQALRVADHLAGRPVSPPSPPSPAVTSP